MSLVYIRVACLDSGLFLTLHGHRLALHLHGLALHLHRHRLAHVVLGLGSHVRVTCLHTRLQHTWLHHYGLAWDLLAWSSRIDSCHCGSVLAVLMTGHHVSVLLAMVSFLSHSAPIQSSNDADDSTNDCNAANDWEQDVEDDDSCDSLTTIAVVIVVKHLGVHLFL